MTPIILAAKHHESIGGLLVFVALVVLVFVAIPLGISKLLEKTEWGKNKSNGARFRTAQLISFLVAAIFVATMCLIFAD